MESVVGYISKICEYFQIEGTVGGDPKQEAVVINPAFSVVPDSNLVIALFK